jgi:hypothetical protein
VKRQQESTNPVAIANFEDNALTSGACDLNYVMR